MIDLDVTPVPVASVTSWDDEADVVIAGYGVAGAAAAVEASRSGADVLVLERTGSWGGAAAMAGGFIYLGGGTALQKACGMGKSGLFRDYLIKMAQVITWFSLDDGSGFTYWPDGPLRPPKRLLPPVYNRGVVVQNEMMVHRGEANGPLDQQIPAGLAFDTVFTGDPQDRESWLLKNGDEVIARHHTDQLRFLVHWSAEVFSDFDELKKNMEGSDDLTIERAIDMMVDDVSARGIKLDVPAEPLHDPAFIAALNAAYDLGGPSRYPDEAPISAFQLA